MDFQTLFRTATGFSPYRYQQRFASADKLPELLAIPTGLGKTAAVVLGWLWRRRFASPAIRQQTPRRLVYCLPMRVLVEQTRNCTVHWLERLSLLNGQLQANAPADSPTYDPWGGTDEPQKLRVHLLLGGDVDHNWDQYPERDAILIGTQDMLLSRALNRGYSMSRFRWPMPYGLLNNDSLWVMDEVQLMGSGLATTTQLQAFRDQAGTLGACRSLWASATIDPSWLKTVDLAPQVDRFADHKLEAEDQDHGQVATLVQAAKPLERSALSCSKQSQKSYARDLAAALAGRHAAGSLTLAIVNTVDRAVQLLDALKKLTDAELLLLHSRFRPPEREEPVRRLTSQLPPAGRIIVSTQVVEAGVDLDARLLLTELAPWPSLVQRFGRCNRKGCQAGAQVIWVDVEEKLAPPYDPAALEFSRERLAAYNDVGISRLGEEPLEFCHTSVIRRKDVVDLFDTTPDLTGEDIDISGFIRDGEDHDVQVFWRADLPASPPADLPRPRREELCPVPVGELREVIKKKRPA